MFKNQFFSNSNGLFKLAKDSKYKPNIVISLLIAFAFVLVPLTVGAILSKLIVLSLKLSTASVLFFTIYILFAFTPISILVFLYMKKIEGRSISQLGFIKHNSFKDYIIGFFIGILSISIIIIILYLTGDYTLSLAPNFLSSQILFPVTAVVFSWIIQGASEEIITRGWLMHNIGAKYNVFTSILISSVFFAILHTKNSGINPIAFINLIIYSVFAALYVIRTNQLWGVCGFHSAWNWSQGNVYGVKVSGNPIPGGHSIFNLSTSNNNIFTGGGFGLEGSIICSIVLILGMTILLISIKNKSKTLSAH